MQWPAVSPDRLKIYGISEDELPAIKKRVTSATTLVQLQQILLQEWNTPGL